MCAKLRRVGLIPTLSLSRQHSKLFCHKCLAQSALLPEIFRATETKIISTSGRARVHAPARIQSLRRIVPSSATDHLGRTILRPFGISYVTAHEAWGEPIRYPLRSIARQVVYIVGTLTRRVTLNRGKSSRIRTVRRFSEIGVCGSGLITAPGIAATISAARGLTMQSQCTRS